MPKHMNLDIKQKYKAIEMVEKEKIKVGDVAKHFKCGKTQIYMALKHKEQIALQFEKNNNLHKKKLRKDTNEELNRIVFEWYCAVRAKNMPISGPILQQKALEIARAMNLSNFSASNGWLACFKANNNISFKSVGDSRGIDSDSISRWQNQLPLKCWSDLKCVVKRQYTQWKKYHSDPNKGNSSKEPKPIEGYYLDILPFLSEEFMDGDESVSEDQTADNYEIEEIFIKDEETSNDYFDDEESTYSKEYNNGNNLSLKSFFENENEIGRNTVMNTEKPPKKFKIDVMINNEYEPCNETEILPNNSSNNNIEISDEGMPIIKTEPEENSNYQINEVRNILDEYHTDVKENNNRPVEINLSQNTWQDFQKDPTHSKFVDGNAKEGKEVFEIVEICDEGRTLWSDSAVTILLDYVKNNIDRVGKCLEIKNKTKLWHLTSSELLKSGHSFTALQVESKYKSLFRQYKKFKLNPVISKSRTSFAYLSDLEEIFAKQRVNNNPNLQYEETQDSHIFSDEEQQWSKNQFFETSRDEITSKRSPISTSDRQLKVLIQMAADRRREHKELMEFLRQKEEAKAARSKRKEQLLLMLLDKHNKNT